MVSDLDLAHAAEVVDQPPTILHGHCRNPSPYLIVRQTSMISVMAVPPVLLVAPCTQREHSCDGAPPRGWLRAMTSVVTRLGASAVA
jgi:hypothetical protein